MLYLLLCLVHDSYCRGTLQFTLVSTSISQSTLLARSSAATQTFVNSTMGWKISGEFLRQTALHRSAQRHSLDLDSDLRPP